MLYVRTVYEQGGSVKVGARVVKPVRKERGKGSVKGIKGVKGARSIARGKIPKGQVGHGCG